MELNYWELLVFHTLLFIATFLEKITHQVCTFLHKVPYFTPTVHEIIHKVCKLLRKNIFLRCFPKNYDTRKKDSRNKFHVWVVNQRNIAAKRLYSIKDVLPCRHGWAYLGSSVDLSQDFSVSGSMYLGRQQGLESIFQLERLSSCVVTVLRTRRA